MGILAQNMATVVELFQGRDYEAPWRMEALSIDSFIIQNS